MATISTHPYTKGAALCCDSRQLISLYLYHHGKKAAGCRDTLEVTPLPEEDAPKPAPRTADPVRRSTCAAAAATAAARRYSVRLEYHAVRRCRLTSS